MTISPEELAGLSDDERAAIEAEDEQDETRAAADEAEGDGASGEAEAGEQQATGDGGESGDGSGAQAATGEEGEEAKEEPEEKPERDPFVPQYRADAPENADQQLKQIRDAQAELRGKFSDGEIELDAYEAVRSELEDQALALRESMLEARIAAKHTQQALQTYWETEKAAFLERQENQVYQSRYAQAAFDAAVVEIAQKPENANKPASFFLREADKAVREAMGIPRPGRASALAHKPGKKAAAALNQLPPNIGDAPSAELPETGDSGEFAHLDKLSGMELEMALANLSPEQERRYLTK